MSMEISNYKFQMSKKKARRSQTGFTIIELVIYLALFAIVMSGAISAVYNIFESSERNQTRAMLQDEGDFLLAKVEWSLTSLQTINSPPAPLSDSVLWVTRWDTAAGNPWVIDLYGTDMRLSRSGNPPQTLNNSNVQVSNLAFTHSFAGGVNPESVAASFTLSSHTPGGMTISEDFSSVKFLRR